MEPSPGWVRTGFQFNAYAAAERAFRTGLPVLQRGVRAEELALLHAIRHRVRHQVRRIPRGRSKAATRSTSPFLPLTVQCAAGLTPVYRLYNNGQGGAPNHRYTTDLTVRAQMIAQGGCRKASGRMRWKCARRSDRF